MNPEQLTGIYELTLTSPDGRERKMLAFLPTEQVRRNFLAAAAKRGLKVSINENKKVRIMKTKEIKRSVTILFEWRGRSYKRTLLRKNFCKQLDRFYAYFHIGKNHFYFEDDLEDGQPVLVMPGVWMQPKEGPEEYFWKPSVLKVCRIDGNPVEIINNGR